MSEAQVPTSRRVARETILRILYTMEVGRPVVDEALLETIAAHKLDESAADFVQSVVRDVLANKLDLDATITRHASGYKARELTVVDRNIIRMAITEVRSDISDAAMELARKYSAEEATKFIHGVLGSVFGHKRVAESTAVATESNVALGGQDSND